MAEPALVALGHGSRDPRAQATTESLLDVVRGLLPHIPVTAAYLDHATPTLPEAGPADGRPVVVVPLLLAGGYHDASDVPAAVDALRARGVEVRLADALGPDDLVVDALADRAAAVLSDDRIETVLLTATGSARQSANDEVAGAAARLADRLMTETRAAFVSAGEPRIRDALAEVGDGAVVVPYLLAPGRILTEIERACAGRVPIAPVLGDHEAVAELLVRRYRQHA